MAKNINQLKNEARREEQRENWSRAIELYQQAIQRSEEEGEVAPDLSLYNRIGDLFRRQGEIDQAVHYYMQAVDRYAEQGLHTGAIALCNKILRIKPDQVEVYRNLGRLHVATGLVAEARNAFLEYADRMEEEGEPSKSREAYLELAELTEDEELHLEVVDELVEADETERAVDELRQLWERRRERGDAAEGIRDRILELDPSVELGIEEDEEPEEAEPASEEPEEAEAEEELAPSAGAEEEEGELEPAAAETGDEPGAAAGSDLDDLLTELDEAEEETTREPVAEEGQQAEAGATEEEDVTVHLRYAEVLARSGQTAGAVEELESALDLLEEEGDLPRALEVAGRLVEVDPDRVSSLRRRARLALETADEESAVEAYLELADGLGGPGAPEALEAYEQVLELDPDHAGAREALESYGDAGPSEVGETEPAPETLGDVLDELSGTEGADEPPVADAPAEGEDDAATEDDEERAYVDLGDRIHRRIGSEQRAKAGAGAGEEGVDFDDMLVGFRAQAGETSGEADPEEHVELGVALRQMGLLDDAVREFQLAARHEDPPVRAYELLGKCFIEKDEHSVAVRVLTRALRLPGYSDFDLLGVLYQLGVAHQEVEELGKARDCFERVYSVDIDFRDVAERLETVSA